MQRATIVFRNCLRKIYQRKAFRYVGRLSARSPVLVLGVQKSGTTVIAALLSKVSRESATLDIRRSIAAPEWKVLLRYGIGSFEEYVYRYRKEFSRSIIKEPGLTFFYQELRTIFPNGRYVMVQRHPLDTIRSTLDRLGIPGDRDDVNPKQYESLRRSKAWRINMDTTWLGYQSINYIDALAFRWKLSAKTYLDRREEFALVRYEDFLNDKVGAIEHLAERLSMPVVRDIGKCVNKQYQPKGEVPVSWEAFYGRNLDIIKRTCGAEATSLGYTI